ncbi:MAG: hypothetical protein E7597_08630 [Ruminococcaceae bacterium]|nr:hypothetical protein [Oscillospiraceae bacterium]
MKIKTLFLLLLLVLALCLATCGGEEAKRPVDYTGTEWSCEDAEISFSVSDQGIVENAVAFDKKVTVVFSDISEKKVSFYSADGKELYFSGSCTYGKSTFTVTVSDIYSSDFSGLPARLIFKSK